MEQYQHDIFYDIDKLSLKKKKELLYDAKKISYEWWVDILDCNVSMQRQKIEMEFEEAIKKCNKSTAFVFIHRRGYKSWVWRWNLEVGYRAMTNPDYFLWIHVNQDRIEELVKKYELELM